MKKKLISWFLMFCMLLSILPAFEAFACAAEEINSAETGKTLNFTKGSGTKDDPYTLQTRDDLILLSTMTNNGDLMSDDKIYFLLVNDIDLSGVNWIPIGSPDHPFTGSFDGNGHVISGLTINTPTSDYVGFFGYVNGGEISKLSLTNVDIVGQKFTGGLVGFAYAFGRNAYLDIRIDNCYVEGNVSGGDNVGGLIGRIEFGVSNAHCVIENCSISDAVCGINNVGGLVGGSEGNSAYCLNIHTSCNASDVSGEDNVGGIIGSYESGINSGEIYDCFNSGDISGDSNVGGIAGNYITLYSDLIWRCYNSGNISTGKPIIGSSGTWHNSYFLSDEDLEGALTSQEMTQQASFVEWDFETTWEFGEVDGYPYPTLQGVPFTYSPDNADDQTVINILSRAPEGLVFGQSEPLRVSMTFDHEIESVDTTGQSGHFKIVTTDSSGNLTTIYQLAEESQVEIDGCTLTIDVSNTKFIFNEIYYVLMDNGVISFKGTDKKIGFTYNQWNFTMIPILLYQKTPDVWKFYNGAECFASDNAEEVGSYYITGNDYARLTAHLHLSEVKPRKYYTMFKWSGSCYGMSVWLCLTAQGLRSASDIIPVYDNLYEAELPGKNGNVASAINYYQSQQLLSGNILMQDLFASQPQEKQLSMLEKVAQEASTDNKYGIICFEWKPAGSQSGKISKHAVAVYGIEYGEWMKTVNGITDTYTKKALIYDCSYPYYGDFESHCIYFNDDTWCIPGYDIRSTTNELSADPQNNGKLCLVTNSPDILNAVDYVTGDISSMATAFKDYCVFFGFNAASSAANFEVRSGNKVCVVENGEVVDSSFDEQLNIIREAAVTSDDVESMYQYATLVLHDSNSSYTVTTTEPICYDIKYDHSYASAISDSSGIVVFSPDGGVTLTNDNAGEYTLQLIADAGYHTLPWHTVLVSGADAENISAQWVENGIKLSGDSLDNISITASDSEETIEVTLDTDYTDILLKENQNTLIGYVDSNNDGIFETPITNSGSTGDNNNNDSSSGNGGGGSSTDNTPSVSMNGNGGKISASSNGTVTITPDEGYQIGSISVNGEQVAIPSDGILTGLDSNDEVVVTFERITNDTELPFVDVSSASWYADAVQYVYENGMMRGTSETMFSPDETTTRAMIVTILHRIEGEPAADASSFTDVMAGSYYTNAVAWAAANGIVNGVNETSFAPDNPITREQLAAILYRYAQFKGYDTTVGGMSLSEYADASQISAYATTAMQWANAEGLITGVTDTTLSPQGSATRAQVATILMRFVENIAK